MLIPKLTRRVEKIIPGHTKPTTFVETLDVLHGTEVWYKVRFIIERLAIYEDAYNTLMDEAHKAIAMAQNSGTLKDTKVRDFVGLFDALLIFNETFSKECKGLQHIRREIQDSIAECDHSDEEDPPDYCSFCEPQWDVEIGSATITGFNLDDPYRRKHKRYSDMNYCPCCGRKVFKE